MFAGEARSRLEHHRQAYVRLYREMGVSEHLAGNTAQLGAICLIESVAEVNFKPCRKYAVFENVLSPRAGGIMTQPSGPILDKRSSQASCSFP